MRKLKQLIRYLARRAVGLHELQTELSTLKRQVRSLEARTHSLKQRIQELAEASRSHSRQAETLSRRTEELEEDIVESRRLGQRVAHVTDAIGELLLPLADRDEAALRERLEAYDQTLKGRDTGS